MRRHEGASLGSLCLAGRQRDRNDRHGRRVTLSVVAISS